MRERAYFVYVMSSLSRTLYKGVTFGAKACRRTGKEPGFYARHA
jgi:hypothetical protein